MTAPPTPPPSRLAVGAAFAAVWFIWGSTYLAIAWAVEALPPFLMAGARFVIAGGILLAWRSWRGDSLPGRREWLAATVTGGLLLLGGNGAVVWSEQVLPSGLVALIVASVPAWMVLFDWAQPGGHAPTRLTIAGVVLGFAGVLLLVGRTGGTPRSTAEGLAALAVLGGSGCWALGSVIARRGGLPASPLMATAAQMLAGGALLLAVGLAAGETSRLMDARLTAKPVLAIVYLITFGSLIAFSCYAWLLRVSTPAKVATYAYVNPAVAVALGTLAGEPLHGGMLVAAALIVAGVVAITAGRASTTASARGLPAPARATN